MIVGGFIPFLLFSLYFLFYVNFIVVIQVPSFSNVEISDSTRFPSWEIFTLYVLSRGSHRSINPFDSEFIVSLITDRKSTRLNSSHVAISYAVFCLKKKTLRFRAI